MTVETLRRSDESPARLIEAYLPIGLSVERKVLARAIDLQQFSKGRRYPKPPEKKSVGVSYEV